MTTRWEKRDKKRSAKLKIRKQSYNSFGDDDFDSLKKKKRKKRYRSKNIDYDEYINETDVE